MSITGIVLAGGKGKRMGGVDKGLVEFNRQPMVAHVLRRLEPQVDEILINANRELQRYNQFGYRVIEDEFSGFAGPLAGLHAGMQHAQSSYILTTPVDSPLLPSILTKRLLNALIMHDADIAVAHTGKQAHPVFSLCRRTLLPVLEQFLNEGGRKMADWIAQLDHVAVSFSDQPCAFININTLEELSELEQAA